MPPIATSAISSKSRGELARDEGAQKPIGKDSPVIQPNLEIVGRSLDRDCRLETRLTHFLDGVGDEIVYQAEHMRPLRPHEDVSPASVISPQPSDASASLLNTPVSRRVIASLSFETPISKRSRRENDTTSTTGGSCRQFCRPRM